jgi:hypothetical protein
MRQLQNMGKVAEVGGSGAEVNPRTPLTLLPPMRISSVSEEVRRDDENEI